MRDVVDKIRLDLNKPKVRTSVSVCRGDTISRTICITLLNSGVVYEIPNDAIATLSAIKSDGRKVYNDCVIQENEICYTIQNQLIATAGDVECRIQITASDGTVIHSPVFIIRVYEKLFDESILESTNDYSALQTYCIRAESAANNVESTAKKMEETVRASKESKTIEQSIAYILLVMNSDVGG